jgi:oligopeptidase B
MNKLYFRRIHLALLSLATLILAFVFVLPAADTSPSLPAPPVAKKERKVTEINGQELVDNYFWLRDKKNPDAKAYLDAENVYTDAVMKPTAPLQKKLYEEMLSRIKETDVEVPYKEGDYFYYVRTEAGKQYGIRCRKKGSLNAPEEILIDVNELAKGQKFMSLGAYDVSDDGNLLAYSTDNTGFRQYTLAVKDLRTGKTLVDHAERVDSVACQRQQDSLLHRRGSCRETPVPTLPSRCRRSRARHPDLRRERRKV